MIFRAAAISLDHRDAQKTTLDGLEAARENGDAPSDDFKDLQGDIVTGIRAGKLDPAKLQADYAAIDKTLADQQAKEEVALSGLYAALTPAQRTAVVTAVRAKQSAREAQFDAHGGTRTPGQRSSSSDGWRDSRSSCGSTRGSRRRWRGSSRKGTPRAPRRCTR